MVKPQLAEAAGLRKDGVGLAVHLLQAGSPAACRPRRQPFSKLLQLRRRGSSGGVSSSLMSLRSASRAASCASRCGSSPTPASRSVRRSCKPLLEQRGRRRARMLSMRATSSQMAAAALQHLGRDGRALALAEGVQRRSASPSGFRRAAFSTPASTSASPSARNMPGMRKAAFRSGSPASLNSRRASSERRQVGLHERAVQERAAARAWCG